jgi:hypothetical protein
MVPVRGDQESLTLSARPPAKFGRLHTLPQKIASWALTSDSFAWIGILLAATERSLHRRGRPARCAARAIWACHVCGLYVPSAGPGNLRLAHDGLNKSKLPMTATERSPYRSAWTLKRKLFGILDAGNDH